jgi:hypothetical protein
VSSCKSPTTIGARSEIGIRHCGAGTLRHATMHDGLPMLQPKVLAAVFLLDAAGTGRLIYGMALPLMPARMPRGQR